MISKRNVLSFSIDNLLDLKLSYNYTKLSHSTKQHNPGIEDNSVITEQPQHNI